MKDLKDLKGEELKRELSRRSNDEFLVFNPTDEDFKLVYDGRIWIIPRSNRDIGFGKGFNRVPRYITVHYMDKMSVYLINQEYDKKIAEAKENAKSGDHFPDEELRVAPRTNDMNLRKKYISQFKIKLVRHYGLDEETYDKDQALAPKKDTFIMDAIMEELEAIVPEEGVEEEVVSTNNPIPTAPDPLETAGNEPSKPPQEPKESKKEEVVEEKKSEEAHYNQLIETDGKRATLNIVDRTTQLKQL